MRMLRTGLPSQAQELLKRIPTAPDGITLSYLVDALGWSQTEIYQIAEMLVESGWIERKLSPGGDPTGGSGVAYSVPSRLTDAPR